MSAPRIPFFDRYLMLPFSLSDASEMVAPARSSPSSLPLACGPSVAGRAINSQPTLVEERAHERDLCGKALEGDSAAWNALIAKHDHRVTVSLLARGVRIDRAKDIAQETSIRLIEQQRAGRLTHLQLPGLAIAQAAFLSLEATRRESSRSEPLPLVGEAERAATDMVDPGADAETRLLTTERVERAEEVLAGLAPKARAIFKLTYGGEGLSHAEVAKKVGLSLQRVRQILCEVRKDLRAALEGEES